MINSARSHLARLATEDIASVTIRVGSAGELSISTLDGDGQAVVAVCPVCGTELLTGFGMRNLEGVYVVNVAEMNLIYTAPGADPVTKTLPV